MYLVLTKDSTIPLDLSVVWANEFPFCCSHLGWHFWYL